MEMKHKKRRLCLFAGFDKNGEIAEYVIYYLKALAQIADVYYWGDFEASESEKAKIEPYCKAVYCSRHGKYDFGSWQELIEKIGRDKIETYDEVILANDSCYGPLFDLSELFKEMDQRKCDFWGLSMAHLQHIHLQSYFIVLGHSILQSDIFYDFMSSVKPEKNHRVICACYEQRFTYTLNKAGFKFDALIPYGDRNRHPYYDIAASIRDYHFPLLKIKLFTGGIRDQVPIGDWRGMISGYSDYPIEIIEADLQRRGLGLDEVEQILRENHDPSLNQINEIVKLPWYRKIIKKCVYRIGRIFNGYFYEKLYPYDLRDDALARNYRKLKREFDTLSAQVNGAENKPKVYRLESGNQEEAEKIKFALRDYTLTRLSPFPLPLTDESDVLLIGNMSDHNMSIIGFDDYYPVFLNNLWVEDDHPNWFEVQDFGDFQFYYGNGRKVRFDLIVVQPFFGEVADHTIRDFIENLKKQIIYEAVLVMIVKDNQAQRYQTMLESAGLVSALKVHGLVIGNDPFEVYYDKIKGIKGYETLIYKIK